MWWVSDYTDEVKYPHSEKADADKMAADLQDKGHYVDIWEWKGNDYAEEFEDGEFAEGFLDEDATDEE